MKRFWCKKCERKVRARSLPRDSEKVTTNGVDVEYVGTCRNHPNPIPSRRPMSFRALKGA